MRRKNNASIILIVIGLIVFMKFVNRRLDEKPFRNSEYILAGCGILLFCIGIYAIRKASKASKP